MYSFKVYWIDKIDEKEAEYETSDIFIHFSILPCFLFLKPISNSKQGVWKNLMNDFRPYENSGPPLYNAFARVTTGIWSGHVQRFSDSRIKNNFLSAYIGLKDFELKRTLLSWIIFHLIPVFTSITVCELAQDKSKMI